MLQTLTKLHLNLNAKLHLKLQKWSVHGVLCTFWIGHVLRVTTACTFSTSEPPKMVRTWCVLYILTWKCASRHNGVHFFNIRTSKSGANMWCFVHIHFECASRHNGVHFFDISTSKSGPRMVCFVHFDLEMCFAPQRRALFRHLNFQKWSEPLGFWTFWLRNVLSATTPCTCSTSQLPKVVRRWGVLYLFTSKSASRHNGVQLFISHLPRCLRTCRFSEPTFQPSGTTKPRIKHSVSRHSYLFAHLHLLSSDLFTSDSSPCWLLFHLSILSEVWLLNFLR